ncbi:MAG: hypothetical protein IJQ67_00355 [Bacilli bacterium]|nr:hypothetical protein [Bacilli bacterium]
MMNRQILQKYIDAYKKQIDTGVIDIKKEMESRDERVSFYREYTKDKTEKISYDDFTAYVGTLWASLMYGNKKYIVDLMIEENGGLESIAKKISSFLYGKEDFSKRWSTFLNDASRFGPSYMSELLCYLDPNEYAITNSRVVAALGILGVEDLPKYKNHWTSKKYLEICSVEKEICKAMRESGIETENLLAVDYFLWEVAKDKDLATSNAHAEKKESKENSKTLHREMIDKIIDIGNSLGFETEDEVKVAKGAVVDAVWKVKIGNMGMIMYVFEVQSKGSIDSLILNLQKSKNNPAVQRLIAVSDGKQLQDIKNESESIPGLNIVLWDFDEVNMVHESLNTAFGIINKLELVPPDFHNN